MDILMFCLQLNDLPDYESLKRSLTREESSKYSLVAHNLPDISNKDLEPNSSQDTVNTAKATAPVSPFFQPTSPNPFTHARVHHYEEIELPLKRNPPYQSFKPSGSGNKIQFRPLTFQNPPNEKQTSEDFSTEL